MRVSIVPVIAIPWGIINLVRRKWRSGVLLIVVPVVLAALAALVIPNFVNARNKVQTNICIGNLRMIDVCKHLWAQDHNKENTDTPTANDLTPYLNDPAPYLKAQFPTCPVGGVYKIGTVGEHPTCSIKDHILR